MVVLVWHTLLLSGVGLDINNISNFVHSHESGERNHSLVLESPLEHISSSSSHSEGVRHFEEVGGGFCQKGSSTSQFTFLSINSSVVGEV